MVATIEQALDTIRAGGMVILVDDEDRENEGDIVAAAATITPEQLTIMARQARGLICLAMAPEMCERLGLEQMVSRNTAPFATAFTISIDARQGVTTGISSRDRATTIRKAIDPTSGPADFVTPGSVFPLRAVAGGVLSRTGQTEGSVDLARLAGLPAAGVICEVLRDDGTMMRLAELEEFGRRLDMPVCTVADLVAYRLRTEKLVHEVATAELPTDFGDFKVRAFASSLDDRTHLALVLGDVSGDDPVLVRVHRANFPGDTFQFREGRGRADVEEALGLISEAGRGVFLYLNREETGADLLASLERVAHDVDPTHQLDRAVGLESRMTFRDFGIGAQILRELNLTRLRVLTNNPKRFSALAGFGLTAEEFIPLP
ncbi:MAG TPA: 3,4-dihydroxy-2-butanone-4-phosphate synthase [Myxococcota bacterium]|nr:3,4-dihydroxy-2-butanone-4-phosphate synthase [Myxococcota bacterium]